jgi:hypothetical protein
MDDPWQAFHDDMPEPKPPTRRARVTRENPRSQVATDPYLNLDEHKPCCNSCEGTGRNYDPSTSGMCWDCRGTGCAHEPLPFRVSDHDGAVFGYPDVYEIHEITHSVAKGKLYGYGYKVLRNGTLSARPCGDAILIAWSDIPAHLHERLTP